MEQKQKTNKVLKGELVHEAPKAAKVKKAAVGDTVHIVQANGFHSAGLVAKVHEDETVNLFVTRDDDVKDHYFAEHVGYSEEAIPGTWHWPEKEENPGEDVRGKE